jgi:hypothetical protein
MLGRIGVALAAIALLLPLSAAAQKGGRSSSRSSRSSSATHARSTSKPRNTSTRSRKSSVPKKSTIANRGSNGKIKRSASARADFMRRTGYPKWRKGYVVDHIVPLECGGPTSRAICSGRRCKKRRLKTKAKETADKSKSHDSFFHFVRFRAAA